MKSTFQMIQQLISIPHAMEIKVYPTHNVQPYFRNKSDQGEEKSDFSLPFI